MNKEQLFTDIRLQLNDVDKLEYQDNELQLALTSCFFEIQKDLMVVNSPLLLKKSILITNETELDINLLRIVSLYNKSTNTYLTLSTNETISDYEYKVFGNKIIINQPPIELTYYAKSEEIILNFFYDIIIDYVVSVCRARIENNNNLEIQALNILLSRVKSYCYGLTGIPKINRNYNNLSV